MQSEEPDILSSSKDIEAQDQNGRLATKTVSDKPDDAMLKRRAVRGGTLMMSASLGVQMVTWSVTIVVMRFLRPEDYAVLTAGSILLNLADRLSEIGIGRALVRKPQLDPSDADEAFTLSWLLSLVMYGIVFLVSGPAGRYFHNEAVTLYLKIAGLTILLTPYRTVGMALLERQLRLDRISGIQVATSLVQGGLVLSLAIAGFGYWAMVSGVIAARLVETVALLRLSGWLPRFHRFGQTGSYLLRFGIHATGSALIWHVYSNMDYMILGRFADPIVLGYYTVGFTLMTLPVDRLTMTCVRVANPVLSRLQHDPQRMWDWYLRLTGLIAFIALPVLAGMALVAPDAIPLGLGDKWQPAVLPFQILSIAGGVMAIANPMASMLNTLNRPELNSTFALICLVVMAPVFCIMGIYYGATGIALAWSVLFPILAFGRIQIIKPITGLSLRKFLEAVAPAMRGLTVMLPIVLLTRGLIGGAEPSWLRLCAMIVVGVLSYAGAIWTFEQSTVLNDLRLAMREFRSR